MTELDSDYLERRLRASLAKAEVARDPAIARVHRDFAEKYERQLARKPILRLVTPC